MTRKQLTLIALAVLLGGLSLYLNKDWFAGDDIRIFHRSRPARRAQEPSVAPVLFGFTRKIKLNSLKVVSVTDLETNKIPRPVWHLISESNSAPIKEFFYGAPIRGMHPEIKGAGAETLEPGVTYRLLVEAGSFKGQHDFVPEAQGP
jgi:hypothetical protein